jgi:diguanylate cyclase (GGDEF)-like protein
MLKRLASGLRRVDDDALSILVVADEAERGALAEALTQRSYTRITYCVSIDEAANDLGESAYDAVLLTSDAVDDVLRAVSTLGEYAAGAPVVLITHDDDERLATEAIRAGAQDIVMHAGLDARAIRRTVRLAVERQRFLQGVDDARRKAEREAETDPLTGLSNRTAFVERLTDAIGGATRRDDSLAVLFMDLDRFKLINDSLGHPVGDELLRSVADRISEVLRAEDIFARFGGDEFALLIRGPVDPRAATFAAQRLLQRVRTVHNLGGRAVNVSASVGIAVYPQHGSTPDELLRNADIAMYDAKGRGGDRAAFASSTLTAAVDARLAIEQRLWSGLDEGDFELYFQPVVDLAHGNISGGEALLRWRDGAEIVSAAQMIPIAEETGLIVEIGRWVVWSAIAQLERWHASGMTDLTVAVNVSPAQFFRGDIVATFRNALAAVDVPPDRVIVELTESAIAGDLEFVVETLNELKEMGLTVAIDDFGTGHSSLSHLVSLPVDMLKIDRSFVEQLPTNEGNAAIVDAIVTLARRLNLHVVAEGIEDVEQLRFLHELGCDAAQGYLFSPAISAEEFASAVSAGASAAAA